MGVRRNEAVGEHFLNLDIGLPTEKLRPLIREVIADGGEPREIQLSAVNRRGRAITVRVVCSRLPGDGRMAGGAILLMDEELDGGP